jgi:hypothetical protein
VETITLNSKGECVVKWQTILGDEPDGIFSLTTFSHTLKWQAAWNDLHPNDTIAVDGIVGPKTWKCAMKPTTKIAIAVGTAVIGTKLITSIFGETEESLRKKVVQAAEGELNNTDPTKYWLDVLGPGAHPKDWCGAFGLWALHQAGLAVNKRWMVGKGFLLVGPNVLESTRNPLPGDIAYFHRSQHHAVVKELNKDGTVSLINGNGFNPEISNGATSEVAASRTPVTNVAAFYSIKPFIIEKLKPSLV